MNLVKNKLDGEHEEIGYRYLKKYFKVEIVEPIKYHVLAKRYLARSKKYYNLFSKASRTSLKITGGILIMMKVRSLKKINLFKFFYFIEKI